MLCDDSNHGRAVANAPDKIEEQRKFVAWWDGAVERKGGDEKRKPRTRLSVIDAQDLTGMKQQRVSDLGQEHVAARHARELAGEGKAELCAAIAARGQRISLGEILKELGLLFGGQADADPRGSPSCAMQTTAPQDGRAA